MCRCSRTALNLMAGPRVDAQLFELWVLALEIAVNGAVVGFVFVFSGCQQCRLVVDLREALREDVGLGLPCRERARSQEV
jgi:hypothetical protein